MKTMFVQDAVLNDRYVLRSLVANGGVGSVWLATDTLLTRDVAVKILRQECLADKATRTRFEYECRAVAAADSDHVVRVFDCGEAHLPGADDAVPYLVMEYVPGRSLRDQLRDRIDLPPREVARLACDVARGLAVVHERGLVHRDIKPANILLDANGRAKIADFGIAHGINSAELTRTGTLVGTARYLAPEQVAGRPATAATDVYALGIVMYECLTGFPPFWAESDVATALLRLHQPPPPLPDHIPTAYRTLVLETLSRDPAGRPTAADVARRAAALEGPSPEPTKVLPVVLTSPAGLRNRLSRPVFGRRSTASAAAACLAVAGAAAAVIMVGTSGGGIPVPTPVSVDGPSSEHGTAGSNADGGDASAAVDSSGGSAGTNGIAAPTAALNTPAPAAATVGPVQSPAAPAAGGGGPSAKQPAPAKGGPAKGHGKG